jgi:hypothetical protein
MSLSPLRPPLSPPPLPSGLRGGEPREHASTMVFERC